MVTGGENAGEDSLLSGKIACAEAWQAPNDACFKFLTSLGVGKSISPRRQPSGTEIATPENPGGAKVTAIGLAEKQLG